MAVTLPHLEPEEVTIDDLRDVIDLWADREPRTRAKVTSAIRGVGRAWWRAPSAPYPATRYSVVWFSTTGRSDALVFLGMTRTSCLRARSRVESSAVTNPASLAPIRFGRHAVSFHESPEWCVLDSTVRRASI